MPLNVQPGDAFPDLSLLDDTGTSVSVSDVAKGQPLFLALFRGPW